MSEVLQPPAIWRELAELLFAVVSRRRRRDAADGAAPGFDIKREALLALRARLLQARNLRQCARSLLLLLEHRHARREGGDHGAELCF